MTSVSIRSVKKNFGEVPIIHGVDIEIKDGSITVLVGPSGGGAA
jgi:multiple sugar transport system ATP-binding protein